AAVVVVPLRFGSGTRLKVLEALAMARPVVSTSAGIEGLAVENGRHLLVADRRDEFASAVELLLSEPELAERLGRAGRRLVEQCYDWGPISERLDWLISEVVAARRG
ncbi:MAG TPA: glycosyltransferase, partial [Thermomicrobiales bacterium]|nr:glycosyltransferase [Thermomicrobiales bacterium]